MDEYDWDVRVPPPDGRQSLLNISPRDEATARSYARHADTEVVRRPVGGWEVVP